MTRTMILCEINQGSVSKGAVLFRRMVAGDNHLDLVIDKASRAGHRAVYSEPGE